MAKVYVLCRINYDEYLNFTVNMNNLASSVA
jgi:hypothetical protein